MQVTLSGRNGRTVQLSVNYDNAVAAVERSLRSDNERTRRLVQRFLITRVCSVCHGTRLRPEALTSQLGGRNIAEISALGLGELRGFTAGLPAGLPAELSRMTTGLLAELDGRLTPLLDVGLSYLTLDRAGASLSTGERQRIELTSTVRASTTGMLYVLDEPSVGLHPSQRRRGCARRSPPWPGTVIPWSWWSTSGSSSAPRTGSSNSAPGPAPAAAR